MLSWIVTRIGFAALLVGLGMFVAIPIMERLAEYHRVASQLGLG